MTASVAEERSFSMMNFLRSAKRKAFGVWMLAHCSWTGYQHGRRWHDGVRFSPGESPAAKTALEEYFDQHQTGPGVFKWRHYFPVYDRHFSKFRGREVHVVEVGIYGGGSLDMWRQYFGEGVHVYGVDIDERCRAYESPGVRVFIGDQADPEFWKRFLMEVPTVDIVIDDGGHQAHQQRATLDALLPHIRPGGVYLCEDVHGRLNPFLDYVHNLSRSLQDWNRSFLVDQPTEFQQSVDSIHLYPFVVVVEKRGERLQRMVAERHGSEWPDS